MIMLLCILITCTLRQLINCSYHVLVQSYQFNTGVLPICHCYLRYSSNTNKTVEAGKLSLDFILQEIFETVPEELDCSNWVSAKCAQNNILSDRH